MPGNFFNWKRTVVFLTVVGARNSLAVARMGRSVRASSNLQRSASSNTNREIRSERASAQPKKASADIFDLDAYRCLAQVLYRKLGRKITSLDRRSRREPALEPPLGVAVPGKCNKRELSKACVHFKLGPLGYDYVPCQGLMQLHTVENNENHILLARRPLSSASTSGIAIAPDRSDCVRATKKSSLLHELADCIKLHRGTEPVKGLGFHKLDPPEETLNSHACGNAWIKEVRGLSAEGYRGPNMDHARQCFSLEEADKETALYLV
ncbi:unnamed protein product, partial [Iphiclides podalirius]